MSRSWRGINEFTVARSHDLTENLKTPTLCLIFGKNKTGKAAYLGILSRKQSITTIDTRVKIHRVFGLTLSTEAALVTHTAGEPTRDDTW